MSQDALPIDEILGPLLRALRSTQAVVVQAPPAAGKTTRLPCALLAAGWGAEREIWVAGARSGTAQAAADCAAAQLGERVGQRVGYRARFEQLGGAETRLRFVTDGVLLERLSSAERGTGLGVVVLDDFHERRVATDLSLMLLRRRLAADAGLRVVVLSTLHESAGVAAYLGNCPRLRCGEGMSPAQIEHEDASAEERPLHLRVSGAVERLVRAVPRGDILTFLPGAAETERAKDTLRSFAEVEALELVALHGELPIELSARAITQGQGQRRKVILASDATESSVGLEGITAVVDSGLARSTAYSPWTDRQHLELRPISQACARRRAARAGGVEPGHVVRLYTEASLHARPEHEQPELERLDLTGPLLTLYACKVPLTPELWLDAPSEAALEDARARLERLGLASGDRVTDLGRRASLLPVPPRLALVALTGAELGIPRRVCLAVALLAEADIRAAANARGVRRMAGDCDVEHLIALYTAAQAERFAPPALRELGLHAGRVDTVRCSYEQLLRNLTVRHPAADEDTLDAAATRRALGLALLAGFPERVASRRGPGGSELLLSTGQVAQLEPESVARSSPFLLVVEAVDGPSADDRAERALPPQLRVRLASPIEASWLIDHLPEGLSERELLDWDHEREAAILISQLCWGEVVLHQSTRPAYPGIATGVLVERAALTQLATLFAKAETLPDVVARSELAAQCLPELGFQGVNELGTRGLLRAACARVISLAELRELDWRAVFLEQLSPEQRRELERQAPEYIVLKGGRRLRVQYARGQLPFVKSRLQDFFGMQDGPAILSGRVPLTLHLLAPNQCAVQITADLAAFWQHDYSSLRRELSRRYPLDAWPEEPRTASAPAPYEQR